MTDSWCALRRLVETPAAQDHEDLYGAGWDDALAAVRRYLDDLCPSCEQPDCKRTDATHHC